MNIDRLIRAVGMAKAVDRTNASGYKQELDELLTLRAKMLESKTYEDDGAGAGHIYCISLIDCMDVVNHMMYDSYGRKMKATGECTFEQFKAMVKEPPVYGTCLTDFTDKMLRSGYDLIRDLWSDNEADGKSHNPDGSFNHDDTVWVDCPDCHNSVPKTAYCPDCGCDLTWDEEQVLDSLPTEADFDNSMETAYTEA